MLKILAASPSCPLPRVFVSQQPLRRSEAADGGWAPIFDISPALQFGQLVYIFGPGVLFTMPPAQLSAAIEERLNAERFDPAIDYLLATGDMTIALAVLFVVARNFPGVPTVNVLRWHRRDKVYDVVKIGR